MNHSYFLIGLVQKLIRCVFSLSELEFIKDLYTGIWDFSKYLHIFEDLRILSNRDIFSVKDQHSHLILWEKYIRYLTGKRHQYSSSGCMLSKLYKPWNACKLHRKSNDNCADNALDHLYQCYTLLFPFSYVAILRHRLDIIVIPILERRKLRLIEVKWFAQDPKASLKIVAYKKALIIKQFQRNCIRDAFNTAPFFLLQARLFYIQPLTHLSRK